METATVSRRAMIRLCEAVLDASLYWTSQDEMNNPELCTARTLAGSFLEDLKAEQ